MDKIVFFMRKKGCHRPYGYVAEHPFDEPPKTHSLGAFFVVKMDEKEIVAPYNTKDVYLNLPLLQNLYPDTIAVIEGEDGEEIEKAVYGYFSERGNSTLNIDEMPRITRKHLLVKE